MTQLDNDPRSARRFNLVDVVVAVVILGLIPIAYGAYLLFRTPPPTLASVSPVRLFEGHNQRVEIEGTNLRPFMRASFNTIPARSFLIGSTKYALVDVPDLAPGTYDVVLYDYMQEVDRLPKALTVVPMVTDVELEVVGAFKSPPDGLAAHLKERRQVPVDRRRDRRGRRRWRPGSADLAAARRRRDHSCAAQPARAPGHAAREVLHGAQARWDRAVYRARSERTDRRGAGRRADALFAGRMGQLSDRRRACAGFHVNFFPAPITCSNAPSDGGSWPKDLARAFDHAPNRTWPHRIVNASVLLLESRLGAICRRAARIIRASWMDSRCRSWAIAAANDWRALDSGVTLRALGWTMLVTAATTLLVQWLGRPGPTTRGLPRCGRLRARILVAGVARRTGCNGS